MRILVHSSLLINIKKFIPFIQNMREKPSPLYKEPENGREKWLTYAVFRGFLKVISSENGTFLYIFSEFIEIYSILFVQLLYILSQK